MEDPRRSARLVRKIAEDPSPFEKPLKKPRSQPAGIEAAKAVEAVKPFVVKPFVVKTFGELSTLIHQKIAKGDLQGLQGLRVNLVPEEFEEGLDDFLKLYSTETDPNKKVGSGSTLFGETCRWNPELVPFVLEQFPTIDVNLPYAGTDVFEPVTPLMLLTDKEMNLKTFQYLLNHPDMDVNAYSRSDGTTVLHYILEKTRSIKFVEMLLQHQNIDVNKANSLGETPLMLAIRYLRGDIFEKLLNRPDIDVNLKNIESKTVSMLIAPWKHKIQVHRPFPGMNIPMYTQKSTQKEESINTTHISLLLERPEVDINAQDKQGQTALHYAIRHDNQHMFKLLIKHPKIQDVYDKQGKNALMVIIENSDKINPSNVILFTELILEKLGPNPNHQDYKGNTWLSQMAAMKTADFYKQDGEFFFFLTKKQGTKTILFKMPKINPNILNYDGYGAVHLLAKKKWSSRAPDENTTNFFNIPGMNINLQANKTEKPTALMIAAKNNTEWFVKHLLKHPDIDVNYAGASGTKNAADIAEKRGNMGIYVDIITHPKYKLKKTNEEILYVAVKAGRKDVVQQYLSKEINVNYLDSNNNNLYMVARKHKNLDLVTKFIPEINDGYLYKWGLGIEMETDAWAQKGILWPKKRVEYYLSKEKRKFIQWDLVPNTLLIKRQLGYLGLHRFETDIGINERDYNEAGEYNELVTKKWEYATVGRIVHHLTTFKQDFINQKSSEDLGTIELPLYGNDFLLQTTERDEDEEIFWRNWEKNPMSFDRIRKSGFESGWNLETLTNGSFHLNFTLPLPWKKLGMTIKDDTDIIKSHRILHENCMVMLQFFEPIIMGCYCSADILSAGDQGNFSEMSYRILVNTYSKFGTSNPKKFKDLDSRIPTKGREEMATLEKKIMDILSREREYTIWQGAEFRRDSEKGQLFGFEFRILDLFPLQDLEQLLRFMILLFDHTVQLLHANVEIRPINYTKDNFWISGILIPIIKEGWDANLNVDSTRELLERMHIPLILKGTDINAWQVLDAVNDWLWETYGNDGVITHFMGKQNDGTFYPDKPKLKNINRESWDYAIDRLYNAAGSPFETKLELFKQFVKQNNITSNMFKPSQVKKNLQLKRRLSKWMTENGLQTFIREDIPDLLYYIENKREFDFEILDISQRAQLLILQSYEERIKGMMKICFPQYKHEPFELQSNKTFWIIGKSHHNIIGALSVSKTTFGGTYGIWIEHVCRYGMKQYKGIGYQMMKFAVEQIPKLYPPHKLGHGAIYLYAGQPHEKLVPFYEQFGFQKTGRLSIIRKNPEMKRKNDGTLPNQKGGRFYRKYLKYKQKYLELKHP